MSTGLVPGLLPGTHYFGVFERTELHPRGTEISRLVPGVRPGARYSQFTRLLGTANVGMNLILAAESPTVVPSSLPLFVFGASSHTMLQRSTPLYIISDSNSSRRLNLVLEGATSSVVVRNMNLYVGAVAPVLIGSLPLVVANVHHGVAGIVPLCVDGTGVLDGGHPVGTSMNMFLRRAPTAVMTMMIQGPPSSQNNSMPMVVAAQQGTAHSLTLAIPKSVGFVGVSQQLYTHGF